MLQNSILLKSNRDKYNSFDVFKIQKKNLTPPPHPQDVPMELCYRLKYE